MVAVNVGNMVKSCSPNFTIKQLAVNSFIPDGNLGSCNQFLFIEATVVQ